MNVKNIVPLRSERLATSVATDTVGTVAALLGARNIGLVVILDDDDALIAVVSERDIMKALATYGPAALDRPVIDIATQQVLTCPGEAHPHDVIEKMHENGIRHMPVIDNGRVSAVVSSRDIIDYLAKNTKPDEQAMMWAKLIKLA